MKVRLFLKETIEEFAENHANGKKHFANWLTVIKEVEWEEPKSYYRFFKRVFTR